MEVKCGEEVFECKISENLPVKYIVAVYGERYSIITEPGCIKSDLDYPFGIPPGVEVILDKMRKEVDEGADPYNLAMFCAYIQSVASADKNFMSYRHCLGYLPPNEEDEFNNDGSIFRAKGEAITTFLSRGVGSYLDTLNENPPVRAVYVSLPEMKRLLSEHGWYGGKMMVNPSWDENDAILCALFPENIEINPKLTTNKGARCPAVWEYTNKTDIYTTCKEDTDTVVLGIAF